MKFIIGDALTNVNTMKSLNIKRKYSKLHGTHYDYVLARNAMKDEINKYAEFEADIVYQESDGFTVLNVDSNLCVAPLDECLRIIKEKGILTVEDFNDIRI